MFFTVFNLSSPTHDRNSFSTTNGPVWIAGEAIDEAGFTRVVNAYAENLPEGEHLLAVSIEGIDGITRLRLARVKREASVLTTTIEGASL